MVLLRLPTLSFLVSPLATAPALASKMGIVCLRVSFRLTVVCLALSCLSPAQYPSALTCQESCAAQGHHRFSVPASTLARKHARLGKTHELRREPLSGDQGWLLARVPSQSLLEPPAGGLHLRQSCPVQRLSPKKHVTKVASLAVHLRPSGTWVEDTSQERCCPTSTFTLILFLEDSPRFQSKRRGTKDTRERALPSHFVKA